MIRFHTILSLILLTVACAPGVEIEPEPAQPEQFECEVVEEAAEPTTPTMPDVEATFNATQYSAPMTVEITLSTGFPVHMQKALVDAVQAWSDMTHGDVALRAVIDDTVCDQSYAIHAAPQGECHMSCKLNAEGHGPCNIGWYTTKFGITIRNDRTDPAEAYWLAVHELGHALGLGHTNGFMNSRDPTKTWLDGNHFSKLAQKHNWNRGGLPTERTYAPY